MKKLIIAATVVCVAAMSQAAAFTWTQNNKQFAPDIVIASIAAGHYGTSSSVNLSGWASLTWAYTIELDNGTKTDTVKGTGLSYKMNKINMESLTASDLVLFNPGADDPDNVVKYSIIITADYTDTNGKKWTITSDAIKGSKSISSLTTDYIFTTSNVSGWTVSSVPEPTSGLLLILGMAGLTLRRRRA